MSLRMPGFSILDLLVELSNHRLISLTIKPISIQVNDPKLFTRTTYLFSLNPSYSLTIFSIILSTKSSLQTVLFANSCGCAPYSVNFALLFRLHCIPSIKVQHCLILHFYAYHLAVCVSELFVMGLGGTDGNARYFLSPYQYSEGWVGVLTR